MIRRGAECENAWYPSSPSRDEVSHEAELCNPVTGVKGDGVAMMSAVLPLAFLFLTLLAMAAIRARRESGRFTPTESTRLARITALAGVGLMLLSLLFYVFTSNRG